MSLKVKIIEGVDGYDVITSGRIELKEKDKIKKLYVSNSEVFVEKFPVLIKTKVFDNPTTSTKYFYASVKDNVKNTVSSSWSNVQPIFKGQGIDYEIEYLIPHDLEINLLKNKKLFKYSQLWGKSSELSQSKTLQDFEVPRTSMIGPGKSVTVQLNAIKNVVKATIQYCCDNNGDVSYSTEIITIVIYNNPKSVKL